MMLNFQYRYVYTYCEKATLNPARGTYDFETKDYCPTDTLLQEIAYKLKTQVTLSFFLS